MVGFIPSMATFTPDLTIRCRLVAAAIAVGLSACSTPEPMGPVPDSGAAYVPAAQWRTAAPPQVGFDPARIDQLGRDLDAGRYGAVQGVVIVRFGYLTFEHYQGWSGSSLHTLQSVTKSVTSLLLGIARRSGGPLANLDTSVVDLFARYGTIDHLDADKRALSLRHLLTMRTSMDFWEQPYPGSPLDQLNRSSGDWVKFVLDRPMVGSPGSVWAYNSGAAILTCGAIRETRGEPIQPLAERELFAPLGITRVLWAESPFDRLPHCGGGLSLTVPDLARIGYLVLREGRWGDRQIVPAEWIQESIQPVSRGPPVFFSQSGSAYGYFWWLFPRERGGPDAGSIIAASGSGGQWLFVVPSLDLIVAIVGTNADGLDVLYAGILPSLQ
jgi:CubicO group peptidase (beta-lactamase class C family)